jgi:2,5-diketo-D-gluconate reductase B
MKYLTVKGEKLPAIGFGTSQIQGGQCTEMVRTALALGYRHIDTAQAYGNEAEVGRGIAQSGVKREEIFLTTKVWRSALGARDVKRSTEESLKTLGTDHVDLLLVHWPNDSIPMGETLGAFAALKAEGKTRHIGVSNYTPRHLKEAIETHRADLFCNQVEYHPELGQDTMLSILRRLGMALVAYSPLGRGRIVKHPALAKIGAKYGKSASQVALAWLVRQDGVVTIPKASSEAHARANLDIFDFTLAPEDLAEIAKMERNSRVWEPSWGPSWSGG